MASDTFWTHKCGQTPFRADFALVLSSGWNRAKWCPPPFVSGGESRFWYCVPATSSSNVNRPKADWPSTVTEHPRIAIAPEVLVGKPVIRGTRLSVEFVIGLMADGWSEADILGNYPGVTHDDIIACLAYARDTLSSERPLPRRARGRRRLFSRLLPVYRAQSSSRTHGVRPSRLSLVKLSRARFRCRGRAG